MNLNARLNSGWEIPLFGLGTYKTSDQDSVDKAIDSALGCGYRNFDTAKYYYNEHLLGCAFQKLLPKHFIRREDIFITTKFFPTAGPEARERVPILIQESLVNLKTSYVYLDLVLIHYPKSGSPLQDDPQNEDHIGNFASRKENWIQLELFPESVIHSIGVSNYEIRHLEEMKRYATRVTVPAVNQVEFHPHFRRKELKEYCENKGIFLQAFSPLGRCHPDLIGNPVIVDLADRHKTTAQNILLSFAISQGVGAVPKSATPERIRENFNALKIMLTPEDLQKLNSIDMNTNYIRNTPWLVK